MQDSRGEEVRFPRAGWVLLPWLIVCAACGGGAESVGEVCDLLPGDFVISEIMVNPIVIGSDGAPSGSDSNHEWFEIYNASSEPKLLDRAILRRLSMSDDGEPQLENEHYVRAAGPIGPREYFVLGDGSHPFYDYIYDDEESPTGLGETFGLLGNEDGGIAIVCRGELIDTAWWGTTSAAPPPEGGYSLGFDGGLAPDALLNDGPAYWCSGGGTYDGTNIGSPGRPNVSCGLVACEEGGVSRDIVAPLPGELVVSEVFVDAAGADGQKYWVELYVAGNTRIDLNEVEIVASNSGDSRTAVIEGSVCVPADPGDYVVVAITADQTQNGGLTPDALAPLAFGQSFFQAGATIELVRGDEVLDEARLPPVTGSAAGHAWQLDGPALGLPGAAALNDYSPAFCLATQPYNGDSTGFGSPGTPNEACGTVACVDGASSRAAAAPSPGDVVISEIYANPLGSTERNKEWIEIYVARGPVDLNGVAVTSHGTSVLASDTCVAGQTGDHVLLAVYHEDDAGTVVDNDGITPDGILYYHQISFLRPEASTVALGYGDLELDQAPAWDAVDGRSQSLMPERMTTTDNDTVDNFCVARTSGLFGGQGTPGQANVCGNTCSDGGAPRVPHSPEAGEIVITEVHTNPTGTDNSRDWVEVLSLATGTVDLNGLAFISTSSGGSNAVCVVSAAACVEVEAGARFVLGGANAANDGVTVGSTISCTRPSTPGDMFYTSSSTLRLVSCPNDASTCAADGVVIDATSSLGTVADGRSKVLDPAASTPAGNDTAACWCNATAATGGFTDVGGSPGLANTEDCASCP